MKLGAFILLSVLCTATQGTGPLDIWDGVVGGKYFSSKVPRDTYTVLGSGDNPLFSDNDVALRWIGNSSAFFRSTFLVDADDFAADRVLLVFQGVDTFAKIKLNDYALGNTSNMHLRYAYDVKDYLLFPEQNKITMGFESAVKVAEELYNNHSKNYPVYPKCVPSAYNGECHVNHIRKMQASFSWDWGPALPGAGLWSVPRLIAFNQSTIFDTTTDVELTSDDTWTLTLTVHLENAPSSPSRPISGTIVSSLTVKPAEWNRRTQKMDAAVLIENTTTFTFTNNEKTSILSLTLLVPDSEISRWWPNGYGPQKLYTLNTTLTTSSHVEYKVRDIGFRTVKLIQEPLQKGLSFYFKVNDVPIFAKGTNLIPISILAERTANTTVRGLLLRYMQETHQNMVRVWGGGIYEIDEFYSTADKLGIMIWQDFMFACAMYPTTSDFLASVREEVQQTVWRLKSHASVVLWAGNNENEAALYGNWYGTGKAQIYKDDYIKLYVNLIKKEVDMMDKTRPFLVSSPTNGLYSEQNGWVETNPYSNIYGDIHYYNYVANSWDMNTYKRPRFASEYGFQSLPSIRTLRSVSRKPNVDMILGSEFLKHRQHLPAGNAFMTLQIKHNLQIPNTSDPLRDFESYIYLSQLNQAVAVKVQTESYRQAKSSLNEIGEGRTMGALYWQLNDVWQAPSWSSVDVDGRWKMLHNYAEEFFAPVIVTPRVTLDELKIFVVSDSLVKLDGYVEMVFHRFWNGTKQQAYRKRLGQISVANSAVELPQLSLSGLLQEASCGSTFEEAKKNCLIELVLKDLSDNQVAPSNWVYPAPPKDLQLPACDLFVQIKRTSSFKVPERLKKFYTGFDATVKSDCAQLFVWFDSNGFYGGRFSENGFHLMEGSKEILFLTDNLQTVLYDIRGITVTSLAAIYSVPKVRMEISLVN